MVFCYVNKNLDILWKIPTTLEWIYLLSLSVNQKYLISLGKSKENDNLSIIIISLNGKFQCNNICLGPPIKATILSNNKKFIFLVHKLPRTSIFSNTPSVEVSVYQLPEYMRENQTREYNDEDEGERINDLITRMENLEIDTLDLNILNNPMHLPKFPFYLQ